MELRVLANVLGLAFAGSVQGRLKDSIGSFEDTIIGKSNFIEELSQETAASRIEVELRYLPFSLIFLDGANNA